MSEELQMDGTSVGTKPVKLEALKLDAEEQGDSLFNGNLKLVRNVKIKLSAIIGGAEITVGELFELRDGSVLKLDKETQQPIEVFLGDNLVAIGNLVVVGDHFGVGITKVVNQKP